jgi:hypothetical protein
MAASRTLHGPLEDAHGLRAGLTAVHWRILMAESRTLVVISPRNFAS